MAPNTFFVCCTSLLIVAQSGCVTGRRHVPLLLAPSTRLVEVELAGTSSQSDLNHRVVPAGTNVAPRNVLVLSGGGANGAYTAGVLNGWTASGTRPTFDVVTGISTGALIAPFAFLGSEYDDLLRYGYTSTKQSDIFKRRWLPELLWSDSIADSAPLKVKIASEITPKVLSRIADAHRAGRRLYVGTTDLDSKRLVVWDLGAIACRGDLRGLRLFRDVLLASASVPGLLPPVDVEIDVDGHRHTELHVDGGVAASFFLQPAMMGINPEQITPKPPNDSHVYVVIAGQLELPRRVVKRRLTNVIEESIGGVLQSQLEGDLLQTYLLARFAGASFSVTSVPKDVTFQPDPLVFDPATMQKLFETGYKHASPGHEWQDLPANLSYEKQDLPRGGVEFTVFESADRHTGNAASMRLRGSRWVDVASHD